MTHSLKARSPRESGDVVRFESRGDLIDSLGEVLACSASQSFEVRVKAWLWLERHGEAAARALASASAPPERVEDATECACRQERPLAVWERDLLGLQIQSSPGAPTAREIRVLRASLGVDGLPQPLAKIALDLGLTRERVRQIEGVALQKLGIRLPKGMHRTPGGRWKRARLVLRELASPAAGHSPAAGLTGPEAREASP